MLVKVLQPFTPDGETTERRRGEVFDMEPAAAQSWIRSGHLRAHIPDPKLETKREYEADDDEDDEALFTEKP